MRLRDDYRPLFKFEGLYEVNAYGQIKVLKRYYNIGGNKFERDVPKPEITYSYGGTMYTVVLDANFKRRKINLTKAIRNVFGKLDMHVKGSKERLIKRKYND